MTRKIAITTPTGKNGSALTKRLLDAAEENQLEIVLLARDPEKVLDFTERGARVEKGSLDPGGAAKQERFCREYVTDHNGAAAARRAGYSKNTARVIAAQLLAKLNIRARIQTLTEAAFDELEI